MNYLELRLLREDDCAHILTLLKTLRRPVHLLLFMAAADDVYSSIARALLHELVALHPLLRMEVFDLVADAALAAALRVDKAPTIIVLDDERSASGIRFCGLPGGYTFAALLEAVLIVGESAPVILQLDTQRLLDQLQRPVLLQVLVTAAEPSCPSTAVLAYRLACARPQIVVEVIETLAFPQLAQHYDVNQTPATIINARLVIAGRLSEPDLIRHLRLAGV